MGMHPAPPQAGTGRMWRKSGADLAGSARRYRFFFFSEREPRLMSMPWARL
jgi:hypothetical protein